MNNQQLVSIAIDIPARTNFTYKTDILLKPGQRVLVPFGKRKMLGWVIGPGVEGPYQYKKIFKVYDEYPLLPQHLLNLAFEIAHMYFCSVGSVLAMMSKNLSLKKIDTEIKSVSGTKTPDFNNEIADRIFEDINKTGRKFFVCQFNRMEEKIKFFQALPTKIQGSCAFVISNYFDAKKHADTLKNIFGDRVIFFTGESSKTEKVFLWHRMLNEKNLIIIGTRLALFTPVSDLEILIVDEPSEYGHKENQTPRYTSREVATKISQLLGIPVVFTVFQPDVTDIFLLKTKKAVLIEAQQRNFPRVVISRMQGKKHTDILTDTAKHFLEKSVLEKGKVVIIHNLKGYARLVICKSCGASVLCQECGSPVCAVNENFTFCTKCKKIFPISKKCFVCKKATLSMRRLGIQKIAKMLKTMYPDFDVGVQDDGDTIDMNRQIIIGTQHLVSHVHDISPSLLIFTDADMIAARSAFRSEEKFFLLVEKIKRMMEPQHMIIIQTRNPGLELYAEIANNKPESFYSRELAIRNSLMFPPYGDFIEIGVSGKHWKKNKDEIFEKLKKSGEIYEVSEKMKKTVFLWKITERNNAFEILKNVLEKYRIHNYSIDINPYF
ncbi:MAG TPA: hypothetical protein PLP13_02575 [bacterium]|nr:hypothetical protein [bacterium]